MNKTIKLTLTSLFLSVLVTACNSSASSDAKKIEVAPAKKAPAATVSKESTASSAVVKDESLKVSSSGFIEGQHYVRVLPEMQTDVAPGKVEVAELFWFGCPHCYSLEPEVLKYKANHPDYVEFKQVPAMLNPSWAADANTFYIADILDPKGSKGLVDKIFKSIHEQKRRLRSPKAVTRFFVEQGYTEEQIDSVKKSMAFQAKLVRAQEFGAGSQANSVPTIIVNGKYRTSPHMAGGNQKIFQVVKMLAEKENEAK